MPTTSSRANPPRSGGTSAANRRPNGAQTRTSRKSTIIAAVTAVAVLLGLYAVYANASNNTGPGGTTAASAYDVGSPGVGETAPAFTLESATGNSVSLADYRGKNVLLYFQEGLMCQPCWTQITDLEKASDAVAVAGIDAIVSITTDPVNLLAQKVKDDGITTTPVLADPDLAVSRQYATNQYGMMGDSRNGHSLILVGPDGRIQWRADYGGAPNYTMYVPVDRLLADLRAGTASAQ